MTKEFAVAARDHGAGVAHERFDAMPIRTSLPLVAGKAADIEQNLSDFLLRRASPGAVEGPEHSAMAVALLTCQARVGRNGAAVQGRKETLNGFDPVEALDAERDGGDPRRRVRGGVIDDLDMLAVSEVQTERCTIVG